MISNGILLAAGTSARMGSDKLTLDLGGTTPLALSLDAMARAGLTRILITVSAATRAHAETLAASCPVPCALVEGGSTRQESVLLALRQCHDADIVVIHDAARCRMAPRLIRESVAAAAAHGSGIAALPVRDTLRGDGSAAVPRDGLLAMQTPQAFQYPPYWQPTSKPRKRDGPPPTTATYTCGQATRPAISPATYGIKSSPTRKTCRFSGFHPCPA